MAELHKDMPMDQYQASTDRLSKSMLSAFADCPARFKYQYLDGGEKKDTPSLRLGSAVHTLALEPEKWKAGYLVSDVRRDARTEAYKEVLAEANGRQILKTSEYQKIVDMAEALSKNAFALALLKSPGYVESTIFWEQDGLEFRCRPDLLRNDGLVVDLKTARSVKPSFFFKDAANMNYDLSVALTSWGYKALHGKLPEEYVFLAIETEPPYLIGAFCSYSAGMEMSYYLFGEVRLNRILEDYKECLAANKWPGYADKIEPMKVPKWAQQMEVENV